MNENIIKELKRIADELEKLNKRQLQKDKLDKIKTQKYLQLASNTYMRTMNES
jgi:hypothetical protein